ncbi:MAG: hypothetical protein C0464_02240 [Cyanobacteria bacterium DS2.008]|nr:hypothetical protein [Cyanobacteria bacterium DS2.008]
MSNPNWKFYKLTERSQAAIDRLSIQTGVPQTTLYLRRANNKRMRDARTRILEAMKILIAERQMIGVNALTAKSGCSKNTIRKHADLWRGYWGLDPRSTSFGFPLAS